MKSIRYFLALMIMLFFAFVNLYSQNIEQSSKIPVDGVTGLITYQDVVQTEGNKQELFNRAVGWVNQFYVNPTEATKVRSPESGIIEIVHRFKITNEVEGGVQADAGTILYSLKIELRDGRFRYSMDNFVLRQASRFPVERWLDKSDQAYNQNWDNYLSQVDVFAISLVESLKTAMQPEVILKEEEW
ncbi:MAG: DUF4468 domain-containing protein [Bacteroidales bacterium]|nr:DUF4468 domain-containing protein [Bacteroidales bacterium]